MIPDENKTDQPPSSSSTSSGQKKGEPKPLANSVSQAPPVGRRRAFGNMRRELTPEELSSLGVQKILYDDLEQCEIECDELKEYVKLYHEADKRSAVLEEKQKNVKAIEVFFGVGVGMGGAIFGLAPFFWTTNALYGLCCLFIGAILIIGSCVGRIIKQ